MAIPKSFTISRSKWGREALLNDNGTMCCLGFWAKACGFKPDEINGCSHTPGDVDRQGDDTPDKRMKAFNKIPIHVRENLAEINDNDVGAEDPSGKPLSDEEREGHIKAIFSTFGVRVNFKE